MTTEKDCKPKTESLRKTMVKRDDEAIDKDLDAKDLAVALSQLPTPSFKGRRSSFYTRGKRASFEFPKSPWEPDYTAGCNDDHFSISNASEESQNSEQKRKATLIRDWKLETSKKSDVRLQDVCTSTTTLKRSPLPSTVIWSGKGGKEFERFIDKFTGHIAQQSHMGYLLLDTTALLWLKYGNPYQVLKIAVAKRIHPSITMISPTQFTSDIVWLYGAMQQSITGRGKNIVRKHEHTQDGILAWKCFVDTYRYDGDVDIYLAEQQEILTRKFHAHYSGGML